MPLRDAVAKPFRAALVAIALAGGVAAARPAAALTITPIFDASWEADAPAAATAAVNRAISFWEGAVRNPGNVPITFGWGAVGGDALPPGALGYTTFDSFGLYGLDHAPSDSIPQVRDFMLGAAGRQHGNLPLQTAVAHLPATAPGPSVVSGVFALSDAQYLALTGTTQNAETSFGSVGLAADATWDFGGGTPAAGAYDFTAVVEGEISHVLGRNDGALDGAIFGGLPLFLTVLDFYKYDCATRTLDPTLAATCFSVDGGATFPTDGTAGVFDTNYDSSGWLGCSGTDLFDACRRAGVQPVFSEMDRTLMCALGWDMCSVPEPSTVALLGAGLLGLIALRLRPAFGRSGAAARQDRLRRSG